MNKIIINSRILKDSKEILCNIHLKGNIIKEIIEINDKVEVNYELIDEIIDAENNYVLPGLVDINCELGEPGFEYVEDIVSLSAAGARGGYSTINCIPKTNPPIDNKIVVSYLKTRMDKLSKVNMLLSCNMTKSNKGERISEIYEMKKEGIVAVSDGNETLDNSNLLRNILSYTSMFDLPIILFCEDKNLKCNGVMNLSSTSTSTGLKGIPNSAEELVVARNIILSRETGKAIHLTQISCENSIRHIGFAQDCGVKVTCDTSPQYFSLADDNIEKFDTIYKISPPLRSEKDISAVKEGIREGIVNIITSGHSPFDKKDKYKDFSHAIDGISTIETCFYTSYNKLVVTKILTLEELIHKMSTKPAQILNLSNRGRVEVGFIADLFIFDKHQKTVVEPSKFKSKVKLSPYDGVEYEGKIISTIINGEIIF